MNRVRYAVALSSLAILSACQPAETENTAAMNSSEADDVAAITQVRDAWATAWKSGDAAQLAALYAADAHGMNNHMPTEVGPQGTEAGYNQMLTQVTPTDVSLTSEKTNVSGDLAYDRGTFRLTVTPKAPGAKPVVDEGRYLVVLSRQADGSWKLVEAMGNSAVPLPQ